MEWERSQEALKRAVDEHARVESEAVAARAEAARAHLDLGRFASAAYRGNSLPTELSLLVALPSQVGDTLHGLQTLEHSGQVKVDIASYAPAVRGPGPGADRACARAAQRERPGDLPRSTSGAAR